MNFHLSKFQKIATPSRSCFIATILILLWLPLPLGSATAWGWLTLTVLLVTISAIYGWQHQAVASVIIRRNRYLFWGWIAIFCGQLLQLLPLPLFIIEWVRPERLHNLAVLDSQWLSLTFNNQDTLLSLLRTLSFFCLFLLTLLMIRSARKTKLLLQFIFGMGIFQALYGSFSRGSGQSHSLILDLPVANGASGTFLSNAYFSHFLLLTLGAALGLLVLKIKPSVTSTAREKIRRLVKYFFSRKAAFRLGVLFLVFGILVSESVIGVMAACIATTGCALYGLKVFKPRPTYYTYFVGLLVVVDIVVGIGTHALIPPDLPEKTITAAPSLNPNLFKKPSSPGVFHFGVLGAGAGTAIDTAAAFQDIPIPGHLAAPQNDYGQFLIEFGLPLSLVFLAMFGWCFGHAVVAMAKRRHVVFRGAAFACVIGLSGTMIQMIASTPLQSPANAAYVTVLLALSLSSFQCRKYQRA
ncbi:hypothetical protein CA267_005095 [Alteromonas pelagimontana]|uniref:O-antigen ligase family protein n=1 Tax=Alteromonas pelagimontana TaxID=1858656 RepID=A0A6M4MCD5_9ALTE|nr:hypothetical protein [Alteromonas pelagimontana]QJR80195.1 hypothetical protein CA267_005095 [Alteromonas pelagimontana]